MFELVRFDGAEISMNLIWFDSSRKESAVVKCRFMLALYSGESGMSVAECH